MAGGTPRGAPLTADVAERGVDGLAVRGGSLGEMAREVLAVSNVARLRKFVCCVYVSHHAFKSPVGL